MFCYQCEQSSMGTGCVEVGVCGKDHPTACMQDLLMYATQGISMYAHRAGALGERDLKLDHFMIEALFTTVTNVNFDHTRLQQMLNKAAALRDDARGLYEAACRKAGSEPERLAGPAAWQPADTIAGLVRQGEGVSVRARKARLGDDLAGLLEMYVYGLKGAAAYIHHAFQLKMEDEAVYARFHEALSYVAQEECVVDELLRRCLEAGEINYRAMELLDQANTEAYGHPEPTSVRIEPLRGKAIVVSGHDLADLEALLEQTAGKGINVYTHGEMLPALAYPKFKTYPHLVGNYGGAWMRQGEEFDAFPGSVLMTTNCIQRPRSGYFHRIFSSGLVAWPGVSHLPNRDFGPVIEAALAAPGFAQDGPDNKITIGFGRQAVLGVADKVIEAVKSGAVRHFFLIGGCDGAKVGRNYYTELAQSLPQDCMILTLACGKFRFNKLEFGTVAGLPRLLDIGQCNDAYSAIRIAAALADAFECGVNDLPLSLVLSWYEQKAVAILLTLLHLGIRNIRVGPTLPAFITPAVLDTLVNAFQLAPITTPEEDMAAILN